jgi:hypothetical protein
MARADRSSVSIHWCGAGQRPLPPPARGSSADRFPNISAVAAIAVARLRAEAGWG